MYGAVLRPSTELVESGEAHLGVLFLTNEGYSTMCGHATLAVARLVVDQAGAGSQIFPIRRPIDFDNLGSRDEVVVKLHVPCGLVKVIVPVRRGDNDRWTTDIRRPISYQSVPSYATGIGVTIPIPSSYRWPELGERDSIVVDISYGGAFYLVVSPGTLGFVDTLAKPDIGGLSRATAQLKEAFNSSQHLRQSSLHHAEHSDLQFLYGTLVTDAKTGLAGPGTGGAETTLCFFSDAQVDRSPTGSGVQAKVALAYAKGERKLGEKWTYHSVLSNRYDGEGAFVGEPVKEVTVGSHKAVIVEVSGWARYTGASSFLIEDGDAIGEGFWFDGLGAV